MNRVLVVVDVSNLYYTTHKRYNGKKIDYRKLMKYCQARGFIYRAICYASEMKGKAQDFFTCLKSLGFEVKIKEVKQYVNGGQLTDKANVDIDMAVDIIRFANHYDELILVSSDGDMIPAVKYCQEQGIRVHVLACAINSDLREQADTWIEIGPSLLERLFNQNDNQNDDAAKTA